MGMPPSIRWDRIEVGLCVTMLSMGFVPAFRRCAHLSQPVTGGMPSGITRAVRIGHLSKPVAATRITLVSMGVIEGQEIMAGILIPRIASTDSSQMPSSSNLLHLTAMARVMSHNCTVMRAVRGTKVRLCSRIIRIDLAGVVAVAVIVMLLGVNLGLSVR